MKKIAAIIGLLSISLSALAADNVIGAMGCIEVRGVRTCVDKSIQQFSKRTSVSVRTKEKYVQLHCDKTLTEPSVYTLEIIGTEATIKISSDKAYSFPERGSLTVVDPSMLYSALQTFHEKGIVTMELASYVMGNLNKHVNSTNDGVNVEAKISKIALYFEVFQ